MSTHLETQPRHERRWIYLTVGIVLVALVVGGLIAFRSGRHTREANQKADQLIARLEAAGMRAPQKDQVVRVLGDDGGATCTDPNKALNRAVLLSQLANGASGPGGRAVTVDSRVVRGQLLIIEVYCPDQLAEFKRFVDDLTTDDVAGG